MEKMFKLEANLGKKKFKEEFQSVFEHEEVLGLNER
jgi:hypothetical protein